ncbi:MAG: RNA methyltransferase [Planctomycetota bacterium]|nr:RNA methyltransferase [Planctomycetota bacterium]MDA1213406.1 RNA methyltransferase [Planctomycetota bacterium]
MPVISLSDSLDPRLDVFRHIKKSNATRDGLFIAEGQKLVELLLASRLRLHSLLVDPRHLESIGDRLTDETPVYVLPDHEIEQLVGFNFHRGMLACGYRIENPDLAELIGPAETPRRIVVCPSIQDPENLGAVIRISSAFGIQGLILGPKSADPFSRRVLRVSMGTAFEFPISLSNDLAADLALLEQTGVRLIASVLDTEAEPLSTFSIGNRWALLLGNEGHGLEDEWIARAHRRVTIPMHNDVDSLNLSVAAGILLYELTRS